MKVRHIIARGMMVASVAGALSFASAAHAITYDISRTIGSGNTVVGFVVTDGTEGILNAGNITNWGLTLTAPGLTGGGSYNINPATTVEKIVQGSGLVATATELLFNFGISGSFFIFKSPNNNFWCMQTAGCVDTGKGEFMGMVNGSTTIGLDFSDETGSVVIGSVSPVPLPAALPLFAAGAGLIGLLGARRKRRAAAVSA